MEIATGEEKARNQKTYKNVRYIYTLIYLPLPTCFCQEPACDEVLRFSLLRRVKPVVNLSLCRFLSNCKHSHARARTKTCEKNGLRMRKMKENLDTKRPLEGVRNACRTVNGDGMSNFEASSKNPRGSAGLLLSVLLKSCTRLYFLLAKTS